REFNRCAKAGAAGQQEYALVWTPSNKYIIWHEAMHLLNARDCYRDHDGCAECGSGSIATASKYSESKCDCGCIMQYNPNETTCRGRLYVCRGQVDPALLPE